MPRRALVPALWAIAALLAAGIVAAIVVRGQHTRRDDVTAYIAKVNRTAQSFQRRFRPVQRAYAGFSLAPVRAGRQLPELRAASQSLTTLRRHLAAIPAPPEAVRLRRRLLALYDQQEAVARELIGVSAYIPRLAAAEKPLGPAGDRLQDGLRHGRSPDAQAVALRTYAAALHRATTRLRAIRPPALFAASHRSQLRRLEGSERSIRRLAAALATHDRAQLQAALKQVRPAAATNAAARAAIAAYNRRVDRIRTLAVAVDRERKRLDRTLG